MVTKVEEREAEQALVVYVEWLGQRRLHCGECGLTATRVALSRRPARRWRDLAMRGHVVELIYSPHRVWCPHCGLRVKRIPWVEKWQWVTHVLFQAVATLVRRLDWASVAAHFHLRWKTVAAVVEGAVLWGIQHRPGLWRASHSRLKPFQQLARMLRAHLDGVLAWTRIRDTNGAVEGVNNTIKAISHRAFGYRTSWAYIAIYHCCADLSLTP
jgi:transposase